jgi:hypothetical protein
MDTLHAAPPRALPGSRRLAVAAAALLAGVLVASALLLWAHYGTAVFHEMILAGIAYCL